jgi:hypothetical protein
MNSVRLTFSLNAELAVNLAGTPAKLSAAFQRMSGGNSLQRPTLRSQRCSVQEGSDCAVSAFNCAQLIRKWIRGRY